MSKKYQHVVLGGTFDLMHVGHQSLIKKGAEISEHATIGITSDKFNLETNKKTFQNQNFRKSAVDNLLKKYCLDEKVKTIFIDDIFGVALDKNIEAIVVTKDTIKNTLAINKERTKLGLNKLDIITAPFIKDSKGQIISSTRIRNGEINSGGVIFKEMLLKIADKNLPENIRQKLKTPFGKIVQLPIKTNSSLTISVGDITTQKLIESKIIPDISIVDFKTERQATFATLKQIGFSKNIPDFKVINKPGLISKSLIQKISQALKNQKTAQIILVSGEEDLAVIPAVLLSPLATLVFYGQPGKGIVQIKVDLAIKEKLCQLFL